jgi:hypothetical protein
MAKNTKDKNNSDLVENSNEEEVIVGTEEVEMPEEALEEGFESEEEAPEAVEVHEIPLDAFLKNPQELSKYTDEVDVEETTYWCPQCSDYTLFVDRVCTVCGFSKTIKKTSKEDELEEGESTNFELVPNEDLENLGLQEYENDESYD